MGRMRLRGIELAGIRVAVEAPAGAPWIERADGLEPYACSANEPDVYIGVRIADPFFPPGESIVYSSRGRTFEVARRGDDWWIAVHGRERNERVVRFDTSVNEGEVTIHPRAASRISHPLCHPLDELLTVHATARSGGIVMRGTAVGRDGRALVFSGPLPSGNTPALMPACVESGWRPVASADIESCVALRFDAAGIEVHGMPRIGSLSAEAPIRARLDAVHLIERSSAVYSFTLDPGEAAEELLRHFFVPVHDPELASRMAEGALKLVRSLPVTRLGLPEEDRLVPFTWGRRRTALAFAPPYPH
jgi:hypothetical protein